MSMHTSTYLRTHAYTHACTHVYAHVHTHLSKHVNAQVVDDSFVASTERPPHAEELDPLHAEHARADAHHSVDDEALL